MLAGRTREGSRGLETTAIKNDSCVILSAGVAVWILVTI